MVDEYIETVEYKISLFKKDGKKEGMIEIIKTDCMTGETISEFHIIGVGGYVDFENNANKIIKIIKEYNSV